MSRFTPTTILSEYAAIAALNENFSDISVILDEMLSRYGDSTNGMQSNIDMNHFNVKNLAAPVDPNDAVRLVDVPINGNSLALLAASTGSGIVGFIQAGIGAVVRTVQDKLRENVSVKDFGAVGDNSTNNNVALQAALNAIKAKGGGTLYFTAGDYKITTGLLYDISTVAARFGSRIRIKGDGPTCTSIRLEGVAGTALSFLGNPSVSETFFDISGIRISGDNTIGSRGIYFNVAAYGGMDNVIVEAFDQNVELFNVEQITILNSNIRWGRKGLKTDIGTSTAANSIILINTAIANNLLNGIVAADLNVFTMIGGGILNNGAVGGDTTNFGCKLDNPGTALGPIKFLGTVFEGNGGQADLWINSTTATAAISIDSCSFSRASSLAYATNNIRLDGTQPTTLKITTSAFRSFNDYVPNAGRPYFSISNTAAIVHADGTNVFGSATEAPSWYTTPYQVMLTGGLTFIGGGITASTTYDPPSLAAGAKDTIHTMTVTGATLGDRVECSFSNDLAGARMVAWVSATNTVSYYAINENGANPLDLASGTLKVKVIKFG